jgi:hypothetical protein
MAKVTLSERNNKDKRDTVVVKTSTNKNKQPLQGYKWWLANSKKDLAEQLLSTVEFLKQTQQNRYRQAAVFARLYGNMPLFNYVGTSLNKVTGQSNLPIDRPTMNVVQSCVDTLVSRITQSRPRPVFLTDNGDYKERNLAKELNNFTVGELYQTKAYELGPLNLRDSGVLGTGALKIYETFDKKVGIERRLNTELLCDPNDSLYGMPRQLFELKLIDRSVLEEMFPKYRSDISKAEQAYPDNGGDSARTISDQVMIAEAWHLPSSKDATDGRHCIVCTSGIILDEEYKKQKFPFVFLHYSPRILGFWGQGLAEQLMGTQVEINKLLMTISRSINIMGVPRVWLENGSKVVKANFNNQIGMVGTYSGIPPIVWEGTSGISADIYAQLQRLIDYAYQQSGISMLAATSQKPAGLNSGEAIRNYDDLQSDRFASLAKRYDTMYVDLAYQIIDLAKDIAERDGRYSTVFPNKNGTKQIDLPAAKMLDDSFVIQCFDASSLPRDPAGRLAKVTEMAQAGMITMQEARRLLDYPDLEQVDKLANSSEERILQILDDIVESGKFVPPDPFMDLQLAKQFVVQYYNLYVPAKLEESRAQLLRDFSSQLDALMGAAQSAMPQAQPQAVPEARPTSPLLPNAAVQ